MDAYYIGKKWLGGKCIYNTTKKVSLDISKFGFTVQYMCLCFSPCPYSIKNLQQQIDKVSKNSRKFEKME